MAKNVNIVLEREIRGTDYEKYTIYVDDEKYVTGWIKPWLTDTKYYTYFHYMTNKEILMKIKEMYHWLFEF